MQTNETKRRILSIATVALMALAVVPTLAGSASAAAVAPALGTHAGASVEWAYGGEGWAAGGISAGKASLTWNVSAGSVVIFNATNTSAHTIELTASRTVVVTISATLSSPWTTWSYHLKAVEIDQAYVNLTNASTVVLSNKSVVPALGILNASLQANASLKASLVGVVGNLSTSDYLNASGWARGVVSFTPSLGLFPLNLTGVTSWHSWANATGNAAWNLTWAFTNHGWNGTTGTFGGNVTGSWTAKTPVILFGYLAAPYAGWVDHRERRAMVLALSGPFDLYAGVLLIPHDFDIFSGGAHDYSAAGVGASAVTSEYLFVSTGSRYLSAGSITAANMTANAPPPVTPAVAGGGVQPALMPSASYSSSPTVWEQPESVPAAQNQAYCLQFGCASGGKSLAGLVVLAGIVGVAAVIAVALVLSRRSRGRGGHTADVPVAPQVSAGPTPPTGIGPAPPTPPHQ